MPAQATPLLQSSSQLQSTEIAADPDYSREEETCIELRGCGRRGRT